MKIINLIDRIFVIVAMVALFAIMIVISLDGLGRTFFDRPIVGAYVLIESYLMVFPVIGYTWAKRGHISVTLLVSKLPPTVSNVLYLMNMVLAFLFFIIILYNGYNTTMQSILLNKTTNGLVIWPLWLSNIWVPIGALCFCLRLAAEFFTHVKMILHCGISNIILNDAIETHESSAE